MVVGMEHTRPPGTIKRQNLQIMHIEGEEILVNGIYKTFNKRIEEKFPYLEKESHSGTGGFQNTKQVRSEKKPP
jgi:hypothetical protein